MRKAFLSVALVLTVLFVISSCQTPGGRSAGQVVDDSTITTEVKAKLLNDSITKGLAVSVETFEGQVTLTGAVDTGQQREKAGQIASRVKGVKKVNNLVNIKK
jgi:hyperosmotically inducible periplasmic protein